MVSVSICHGETIVTIECDSGADYSTDIIDDLTTRAAVTLLGTVKHLQGEQT